MADWSLALRLEHEVARIITQQEINGVLFDIEKAHKYVEELDNLCDEIYQEVKPHLSKEVHRHYKTPVNKPFLKSGDYSKPVVDWYGEQSSLVGGPFSRVEFRDLELSKTAKLKEQLFRLGWKPTEWNFKDGVRTSPKLTEDSFDSLQGDLGNQIKHWITYRHRRNQIQGWIRDVRPDGRLTAGAITCGTNTGRMRHRTVVNVPKASDRVIFGKQMRSLFIVPDNKVMVGHDASGLELRMLAHYMDDPNYTEILLNGDIHTFNQQLAGLPTRDDAKTFIYALIYGAGDAKLGSIVGGGAAAGRRLRNTFFQNLPKLKQLVERVQRNSQRGYLIGLDGRKLYIRGQHSALNTLLQGAGAVVMKFSMVYLDKWVRRDGLDVLKVIDMHDESQAEVIPEHAEPYGELAVKSIKKAGEFLKLNCPLDAEYKIGRNWSMTH